MTRSALFRPENEAQRAALEFLELEGSSRPAAVFPGAGERVADFVIEHELGRGGAGVVYRARQPMLGRSVALKLIPHGPAALTDAIAHRLEREGRMLASVRHESIPTVHAAGIVPGFHYIAVDLVDGTTLKELIRARVPGLPAPGDPGWLPFLLALLHKVAGALGAAHAVGIVHRDVKPGNVLVDRAGRPFLVDFGLAREHGFGEITLTAGFVGTPQYASPEQVAGGTIGAASDVFSFGVLAFESVTGARPFRGDTGQALARAILAADPPWSALRRIPPELRAVIETCLEKRPENRYADASELEAELGRLLRFEPVRAVARGRVTRAWRRTLRRPAPVLAGAGIVAFLAIAGIAAALYHERRATLAEQANARWLADVLKTFGHGQVEEYRVQLEWGLACDPPKRGAAGRRADLFLLEGEPGKALPLYQRALDEGSHELGDWIGYRAALSVSNGRLPEVDLATGPEPGNSRDYMVLALYHELRGDDLAALAAIQAGIHLNSLPVGLRLLELRYLARLGRTREYAVQLMLACTLRDWDHSLPSLYARTLYREQRFEEEECTLAPLLAARPDDAQLLAERALCSSRLSEHEAALAYAQHAYDLEPRDGRVVQALALVLSSVGRIEEARWTLRTAEREMPSDLNVLEGAARLALESGALDEAEARAGELVTVGARHEEWLVPGHALLGEIESARGDSCKAAETFAALEAREPEIVDWPLQLGLALERVGDPAGSAAALARALALGPVPQVLHARARQLLAAGRADEARALLELGLARRDDLDTTRYWLAHAWLARGNADAALSFARLATESRPDWREAWVIRGRCEAATGARTEALSSYRNALSLHADPAVSAEMAEVARGLGD